MMGGKAKYAELREGCGKGQQSSHVSSRAVLTLRCFLGVRPYHMTSSDLLLSSLQAHLATLKFPALAIISARNLL